MMKKLLNNPIKYFDKILIANRGEIAVRIIRAAHELGIETVTVYSTVEKESLHVKLSDESVCIGPGKASESYLNGQAIIQAAVSTGAQAIHPGFGFLSENSQFAREVIDCGLVWIGPKPETMDLLSDKIRAKETAIAAGVSVIVGSNGAVANAKDASKIASEIGLPVIIKATNGAGGRGMIVVYDMKKMKNAFEKCQHQAKLFFNNSKVYLEKYIESSRHIEVQILADNDGNTLHLYERDCTMQRHNQKLIEEAPSTFLDNKSRIVITEAAVKLAKYANYANAGTVEFLVDAQKNIYFIEMNPRIQVEHPVTEAITGVDIVKEQIKIAANKTLTLKQKNITINGHAIELRINAEDAYNNFCPDPGLIEFLHLPGGKGVRVDCGIYTGYQIAPFYDSMIAKLIVHSSDRGKAIIKAKRCLEEFIINGINNNLYFQYSLLLSQEFIDNVHTTLYVKKSFMNSFLQDKE